MPTYYPSLVLNLKLRFDELLHPVPQVAPQTVDALVAAAASASASIPGNVAAAANPLVLQRANTNTSFITGRVPKKGTVSLNGYRQAHTFEFTIDYRDLPIDPRTIRAGAVEIHLGAVDAAAFGRGMVGALPSGVRESILQTSDRTMVMTGYIDEWDVNDEDVAEVVIRGRDMRAPLLDIHLGANPALANSLMALLDLSQPVNLVVQQILRFNPLFAEFVVSVNPAEWPNGTVPAPASAGAIPRHRRGARGRRRGGRGSMPGSANNMSFWDLIVQVCYVCGAIPYFQGTTLLVRPARSIFDQQRAGFDPSIRTPFIPDAPRKVPGGSGQPFSVRRLVYGRDVQKLTFSRKFGGFARPHTIRCVAVGPDATDAAGRRLEARWPPANATPVQRTNRVAPGGQVTQEEIDTIPVPKVTDQAQLLEVARSLYEQRARLEITGTASTKNLASFAGDNNDPDLLRLQPGDAMEFFVDVRTLSSRARQPLVSTVTDQYRTPFEAQVDEVAARLGDRALAAVIVASARGSSAPTLRAFRVANVKYDWDHEQGVDVEMDFQNYYEARAVQDSVGQDPGSVQSVTVPTPSGGG